jgi:hypothetical protein
VGVKEKATHPPFVPPIKGGIIFNLKRKDLSLNSMTLPLQGGDKRGGKNLPKLVLMKMGKRSFYRVNPHEPKAHKRA